MMNMPSGGGRRGQQLTAEAVMWLAENPKKAKELFAEHKQGVAALTAAADKHVKAKKDSEAALAKLEAERAALAEDKAAMIAREQAVTKGEAANAAKQRALDALEREINERDAASRKLNQQADASLSAAHRAAADAESRHVAATAREHAVAKREQTVHAFVQQMAS